MSTFRLRFLYSFRKRYEYETIVTGVYIFAVCCLQTYRVCFMSNLCFVPYRSAVPQSLLSPTHPSDCIYSPKCLLGSSLCIVQLTSYRLYVAVFFYNFLSFTTKQTTTSKKNLPWIFVFDSDLANCRAVQLSVEQQLFGLQVVNRKNIFFHFSFDSSRLLRIVSLFVPSVFE